MNRLFIFYILILSFSFYQVSSIFHHGVRDDGVPDDAYMRDITFNEYDPGPLFIHHVWIDPVPEINVTYIKDPRQNHMIMPVVLKEQLPMFFGSKEVPGWFKMLYPVNITDKCENDPNEEYRITIPQIYLTLVLLYDTDGDHHLTLKELYAARPCKGTVDGMLISTINEGLWVSHEHLPKDKRPQLTAPYLMDRCDFDKDYRIGPYDIFKMRESCFEHCNDRYRVWHYLIERELNDECDRARDDPVLAPLRQFKKHGTWKVEATESPLPSFVDKSDSWSTPVPVTPTSSPYHLKIF